MDLDVKAGQPTAETGVILLAVIELRALGREALAQVLDQRPGLHVVTVSTSVRDLIASAPADDLIVLYDYESAQRDGTELREALHQRFPRARVLVFNVPDDEEAIIEAAGPGTSGCMLQDVSMEELVNGIFSLAEGIPPVSPRVITALFDHITGAESDRKHGLGLTQRQMEVLGLVEQGLTNKEIATQLSIEHQTVKNHVSAILGKLHVHNRFEIVRSGPSGARLP